MKYLDQILLNGTSGIIKIDCPVLNSGRRTITGFCPDDINVSLGNEWGSILPGLETLTQISQYFNNADIVSWLAGTQACWKGTKPITIPLSFYVFSYNESKNALKEIEPLIELAGVSAGGATGTSFIEKLNDFLPDVISEPLQGVLKDVTVTVHAGYKVNAFQGNTSYIDNHLERGGDFTIKLHIGDQITIDNLLLGTLQITHSNIQVDKGVPLYLKVQADFRTKGVPTVSDIKRWYGV